MESKILQRFCFVSLEPGGQYYKLFTVVIYHHSMVMLSFCVMKIYYPEKYCGMAVYYHGNKFYIISHSGKLKYCGNLPWNFNPRKCS